jgi:hypothetical protein
MSSIIIFEEGVSLTATEAAEQFFEESEMKF